MARHERNSIERMLDRGTSCREIAREPGRAPSTVAGQVARHRFATAPRARHGEPAPGRLRPLEAVVHAGGRQPRPSCAPR
nr:helix-turn-helix domain-containing protein [Olsenella intestinalis]